MTCPTGELYPSMGALTVIASTVQRPLPFNLATTFTALLRLHMVVTPSFTADKACISHFCRDCSFVTLVVSYNRTDRQCTDA